MPCRRALWRPDPPAGVPGQARAKSVATGALHRPCPQSKLDGTAGPDARWRLLALIYLGGLRPCRSAQVSSRILRSRELLSSYALPRGEAGGANLRGACACSPATPARTGAVGAAIELQRDDDSFYESCGRDAGAARARQALGGAFWHKKTGNRL